jgi:hypothetical protein
LAQGASNTGIGTITDRIQSLSKQKDDLITSKVNCIHR